VSAEATTSLALADARPRSHRPAATLAFSLFVIAAVVVSAVFGVWLAPHGAEAQDLLTGASGPSRAHWLGTDSLGRDVFSRIVVGARTAVLGPALVACGAMLLGGALGLMSGYLGGAADTAIMRWVDLMYALPGLLVAIVVVGVVGGGYWLAVLLLILLSAPYDTRLIRGATLEQRSKPYVEAARSLGLSNAWIMRREIWPNVFPVAVANTLLQFAFALVSLSALSFLGLGARPGAPDWGRMLADNRPLLFETPAAVLAPAGAIIVTAVAVNLLGDWLEERYADRGRART
jgi:peptide/nickel transport system permease protein